MNDLFRDLEWMLETSRRGVTTRYPLTDLSYDEDANLYVDLAVSGFAEDEIDIELEGDTLVVTGTLEEVEGNVNYIQQHISRNNFVRRIRLNKDYLEGEISADLENGVLNIKVMKKIKDRKIIPISS